MQHRAQRVSLGLRITEEVTGSSANWTKMNEEVSTEEAKWVQGSTVTFVFTGQSNSSSERDTDTVIC